jgi:hypothetical protein
LIIILRRNLEVPCSVLRVKCHSSCYHPSTAEPLSGFICEWNRILVLVVALYPSTFIVLATDCNSLHILHILLCSMFVSCYHSYLLLHISLFYIVFFSFNTKRRSVSSLIKSIPLLSLPVMFFYSFYDRFVFNSSLIFVVPPFSSHPTSISISLIPVFQF